MKVIVIPIVIGALGMIHKGLVRGLEEMEIEEQAETIQTTALLGLARILSPGDFKKPAVTQIPLKDHQLRLI